MLDPTAAWSDVVQTLDDEFPVTIYESQVPEDANIVVTNGLFNPFIVVYSGGPIRSGTDHHITGSRNDTTVLYWTIAIYSPRVDTTNLLAGQVVTLLAGYRPPDCGEMMLDGGLSYERGSNTVRPTQYVREIAFTARSNLSWNA